MTRCLTERPLVSTKQIHTSSWLVFPDSHWLRSWAIIYLMKTKIAFGNDSKFGLICAYLTRSWKCMQWQYACCDLHYDDVTMSLMASQITSLTIVYSTVYWGADQRKHQSSASLAFVRGIHRGPVNSPHKWPVTRKMFPFDDAIMLRRWYTSVFVNRNVVLALKIVISVDIAGSCLCIFWTENQNGKVTFYP